MPVLEEMKHGFSGLWGALWGNTSAPVPAPPLADHAPALGTLAPDARPYSAPPAPGPFDDLACVNGARNAATAFGTSRVVFPDDYAGPLPPGAIRESQHALLERIGKGETSLEIVTKPDDFGNGACDEEALEKERIFRATYGTMLETLIQTQGGAALIQRLASSKVRTRIGYDPDLHSARHVHPGAVATTTPDNAMDSRNTRGTGSTVEMNPFLDYWDAREPGEHVATFAHELIHALHNATGTNKGQHLQTIDCKTPSIAEEEFFTVGTGPFAPGGPQAAEISENTIRTELGLRNRDTYDGCEHPSDALETRAKMKALNEQIQKVLRDHPPGHAH
jgi:hypothetical protein